MCVLLYFKKRENVRDTRNNKERQSSLSTNPNRTQKSLSRFSLTFIHIYSTRTILFLFSSRINHSMIIPYIHVYQTPACQKLPKTSSQDQSKTIVRWRNERMIDRNNRCCLGEQKPPASTHRWKKIVHFPRQQLQQLRYLIPIYTDNVFGSNRIMLAISSPNICHYYQKSIIFWLNLHGSTNDQPSSKRVQNLRPVLKQHEDL